MATKCFIYFTSRLQPLRQLWGVGRGGQDRKQGAGERSIRQQRLVTKSAEETRPGQTPPCFEKSSCWLLPSARARPLPHPRSICGGHSGRARHTRPSARRPRCPRRRCRSRWAAGRCSLGGPGAWRTCTGAGSPPSWWATLPALWAPGTWHFVHLRGNTQQAECWNSRTPRVLRPAGTWRGCLDSRYSKCGLRASDIGITGTPLEMQNLRHRPKASWIRIWILTRSPGDLWGTLRFETAPGLLFARGLAVFRFTSWKWALLSKAPQGTRDHSRSWEVGNLSKIAVECWRSTELHQCSSSLSPLPLIDPLLPPLLCPFPLSCSWAQPGITKATQCHRTPLRRDKILWKCLLCALYASPSAPPAPNLEKQRGSSGKRDSQYRKQLCFSVVMLVSLDDHMIYMSLQSFLATDSAAWLLLSAPFHIKHCGLQYITEGKVGSGDRQTKVQTHCYLLIW